MTDKVEEYTKEQLDGLRDTAENISGKKLGAIKDPVKLQAIIDLARAEEEEKLANSKTTIGTRATSRRNDARKEATKLVRVNITAMSPFDKQLQGKIFDVGNSVIGKVSRYVPFDTDWHVEQMLVDHIKERRYRTKREWVDPTTRKTMYENRFHKAFGVVVLDNLSEAELKEHQRAMRSREYGEE